MQALKKIVRKIYTLIFTKSGRNKAVRLVRLFQLKKFSNYKNNLPVCYKLLDGNRFVVHQNDYLSLEIYLQREYEHLESRVVKSLLYQDDVVIDIGANVGYYTALLSQIVGVNGKVYAFEPGEITFQKLQQTLKCLELNNVEIFPIGIGEYNQTVPFFTSNSGHDAQQSINEWIGMDLVGGKYEKNTIDLVSIDSFCEDKKIETQNISFIKCDVEGFEKAVLLGSQSLLKSENPPIWQVEINWLALEKNKTNPQEIIDLLDGYSMYYTPLSFYTKDKEKNLRRVPVNINELPKICNLFAFPMIGLYSQRSQILNLIE